MAFFKKIKYALGLNAEEDDDAIIADDPDINENVIGRQYTEISGPGQSKTAESVSLSPDAAMQQRIFTHVVEIFNASLPDFISKSVNPEAQRKYLFDALDADIKDYIGSMSDNARKKCSEEWTRDRQKLQDKVNELESRARDIENRRNELTQKQLSAERQRRALTDRVHDLEKQILTLEAEREQYQLESKSLLNKLKVANVHETENEQLQEEVVRLQNELKTMRYEAANAQGVSSESAADAKPDPAMIQELADTKSQLTETSHTLETTKQQLADKLIIIQNQEKEIAALKKQLEEDSIDPAVLLELEEKMKQFEDIRQQKDNRISELMKREKQLNDEVLRLKKAMDEDSDTPENTPAPPMPKKQEARPIDDILSDTDWLVSPSSLKSPRQNRETHKERKKDTGSNSGQMSLF
ncbi:MAG: hypothetical protein Q4F07_06655 [Bacteroidales bacterium]|nr:hypothetical protein [Bacteroidales bacterium]